MIKQFGELDKNELCGAHMWLQYTHMLRDTTEGHRGYHVHSEYEKVPLVECNLKNKSKSCDVVFNYVNYSLGLIRFQMMNTKYLTEN